MLFELSILLQIVLYLLLQPHLPAAFCQGFEHRRGAQDVVDVFLVVVGDLGAKQRWQIGLSESLAVTNNGSAGLSSSGSGVLCILVDLRRFNDLIVGIVNGITLSIIFAITLLLC